MRKPSQMILEGILSMMQSKGMTTQSLANALRISKKELKRILAGKSPLTVDLLSELGVILELQDSDLQQFMGASLSEEINLEPQDTIGLHTVEEEEDWSPNPVGNHPMQLIKLGFAIGCDMFLVMVTEHLEHSGIPEQVLRQFQDRLPIRLDSAFFHHYKPEFFDDYIEIRLSFDAVYTCYIPWHALEQVTFYVHEDEPSEVDEESSESGSGLSKPTLQIID